ncbi:Hsp20/alpha crystallin family protein [uncultured Pseudodesulfovibrio sp.]|uniref:Hsp20/alpha crystallin family protein n=1 Tax=uncultured Pseudodesulfovibrio sp. TaxID=2035858 RepID=UPI0029C919F0|nr:Hsp20/alpha crystallin family protein [uncultured Pseudodesulfovibrio sp.]
MGKLNTSTWTGMAELDDSPRRAGEPPVWAPTADVLETPDVYILEVELPGMGLEDVHVELDGSELRVFGNLPCRNCDGSTEHLVMERPCGGFARTFFLPGKVQAGDVSARFKDGLLVLTIRKDKPVNRSIPVE